MSKKYIAIVLLFTFTLTIIYNPVITSAQEKSFEVVGVAKDRIWVNITEKDKIKPNDILIIERDGTQIGELKIVEVKSNYSVAEIISINVDKVKINDKVIIKMIPEEIKEKELKEVVEKPSPPTVAQEFTPAKEKEDEYSKELKKILTDLEKDKKKEVKAEVKIQEKEVEKPTKVKRLEEVKKEEKKPQEKIKNRKNRLLMIGGVVLTTVIVALIQGAKEEEKPSAAGIPTIGEGDYGNPPLPGI